MSNYGTRLAECSKILPGIKAEASRVAERAKPLPLMFGAMSLTGVLDHEQTFLARNFQDRIHVCGLSKKMDWNDGFGVDCNCAFQRDWIHRIRAVIHVDKYWFGAAVSDRLGGGHECIGHRNHFISSPNAQRQQSEPERLRAAADADGVRRIAISCEICFEPVYEWTAGEGSDINNVLDSAVNFGPHGGMMGLKIEHGNVHPAALVPLG